MVSPLTQAMARSPFNRLELEPWAESLDTSLYTGDAYAQPLPLTDPEWCNDLGDSDFGPVVCVVDPNTYSSGDLFAAGFVDNRLGPARVRRRGDGRRRGQRVDTRRSPRGAGRHAVRARGPSRGREVHRSDPARRAQRGSDGVPIEDIGVSGIPYAMTRDDLLKDNKDLIAFCAMQL